MNYKILLAFLIFAILPINITGAQTVPFELPSIILEEKPLQDGIRTRNIDQINYSLSKIISDWINLKKKIRKTKSPKYINNIDRKVRMLVYYKRKKMYNSLNNAFLYIENQLYYLYKSFHLKSLPELNFLMIDVEQMKEYYKKNYFVYIASEMIEINDFISITEQVFSDNELLKGRTKLLFKYFHFLISRSLPAIKDKDKKTIMNNINEIDGLLIYFKKLYIKDKKI